MAENLLESELFGHVKGAFTGAIREHAGLFQAADGGTLMLDEIGDMPMRLQVKLLRVLQENQVRPVGSTEAMTVNVRIISATHRDLKQLIMGGHFREDLYYRLNVVHIEMPSLNKRREDVPLLVSHFLEKIGRKAASATSTRPKRSSCWSAPTGRATCVSWRTSCARTSRCRQTPIISAELVQQSLGGAPSAALVRRGARRVHAQLSVADPADHRRQREPGGAPRQAQPHGLLQAAGAASADAGRLQRSLIEAALLFHCTDAGASPAFSVVGREPLGIHQ